MNRLLSFGIPTFNRASILDEALDYYLNKLQLTNYEILVSDNASTDDTAKVLNKYARQFSNLSCFRHDKNIGADQNYLFLQNQCQSQYFLLIGDAIRLNAEALKEIIAILEQQKLDLLVFNCFSDVGRIYGIFSVPKIDTFFYDRNKLLASLGWEMTQISCTVVNKEVFAIKKQIVENVDSYFCFLVRYFNYLATKEKINVYWYSKLSVYQSQQIKSNDWGSKGFLKVWVRHFANELLQLDPYSYTLESKLTAIREFGKYRLFRTVNFCNLIKRGCVERKEIYENRKSIALLFRHSWQYYYILTYFPAFLLNLIIFIAIFKGKIDYKFRGLFNKKKIK